jgi:hypothetical protein
MTDFEAYAEEFEIETKKGKKQITLYPLPGEHYADFMRALKLTMPEDFDESEKKEFDVSSLSPEGLALIHKLLTISMVDSYPEQDKKSLERFVTQNIFKLLQPFIGVNMGNYDESQ